MSDKVQSEDIVKITGKTRTAVKALIIMASQSERLSVREIAEIGDIPVRYLEQIVSLLKKSQLIESIKGAGGGYQLKKDANNISMYDIVVAIEGENPFTSDNEDKFSELMNDMIFKALDEEIKILLSEKTLNQLILEYEKRTNQEYMYYI